MRLLKNRWNSIPVALMLVVLALVLATGVAFAAYTVFAGNANVTVDEALTLSNTTGDSGEKYTGNAGDYAWDVTLYPGQSKTLNILVSNAAPNALGIGVVFSSSHSEWGVTSSIGGVTSVAGGGTGTVTLTVHASESVSPGSYTIYFAVSRGS